MTKHESLNGKVAVITGGGGVLCSGFAKTLAEQGVKVAVLDLNEDAAKKVADISKKNERTWNLIMPSAVTCLNRRA